MNVLFLLAFNAASVHSQWMPSTTECYGWQTTPLCHSDTANIATADSDAYVTRICLNHGGTTQNEINAIESVVWSDGSSYDTVIGDTTKEGSTSECTPLLSNGECVTAVYVSFGSRIDALQFITNGGDRIPSSDAYGGAATGAEGTALTASGSADTCLSRLKVRAVVTPGNGLSIRQIAFYFQVTAEPTSSPTRNPTSTPTATPTNYPSASPSSADPTLHPSTTTSPITASSSPSTKPTKVPTMQPTTKQPNTSSPTTASSSTTIASTHEPSTSSPTTPATVLTTASSSSSSSSVVTTHSNTPIIIAVCASALFATVCLCAAVFYLSALCFIVTAELEAQQAREESRSASESSNDIYAYVLNETQTATQRDNIDLAIAEVRVAPGVVPCVHVEDARDEDNLSLPAQESVFPQDEGIAAQNQDRRQSQQQVELQMAQNTDETTYVQ